MLVRCVRCVCWLLAAAAATLGLPYGSAHAQSAGPFDVFGNVWQVGGIVYLSPKYEGGRSYEANAFPFVAPYGLGDKGILQVRALDDVRWRVLQYSGFEFGPLAGYRLGREEDDAARLHGLGDIDGGLILGGFAAYRAGPLALSLSYHHQVTGDDETGALLRFGADYTLQPAAGFKLIATIGANYATDDFMAAYFGVSPAQSGASGLPVYRPDAGFKDVFVGATASIDLTDRWTLMLMGRYSRLIGDAADSPVVETENQFYGGVGLSYKFNWSR